MAVSKARYTIAIQGTGINEQLTDVLSFEPGDHFWKFMFDNGVCLYVASFGIRTISVTPKS